LVYPSHFPSSVSSFFRFLLQIPFLSFILINVLTLLWYCIITSISLFTLWILAPFYFLFWNCQIGILGIQIWNCSASNIEPGHAGMGMQIDLDLYWWQSLLSSAKVK
jgi:hypothetical protein